MMMNVIHPDLRQTPSQVTIANLGTNTDCGTLVAGQLYAIANQGTGILYLGLDDATVAANRLWAIPAGQTMLIQFPYGADRKMYAATSANTHIVGIMPILPPGA